MNPKESHRFLRGSVARFLLGGTIVVLTAIGTDATASARSTPDIRSGSSAYGTMLFDGRNQAIYLFDKESGRKSRCYGACAHAWPPVLTRGKPKARGEVRQKLLGVTRRRGGATQVTYAGQPLYYYANEGPGEVFCHNVSEFGGTWLVLGPDGRAAD